MLLADGSRLRRIGSRRSMALEPPARRLHASSTSTSARSAPSSAGSAARCPATPSSTCCRRTAAGSTGSSSAPRAPSGWCSTRPCGWSRTPRSGRWPCSATRRWPTRRTPYPPCWSTPGRLRGPRPAHRGHGRRAAPSCRPAAAGCSPRSPARPRRRRESLADGRSPRTAGVPHRIVTDIAEQLALWRIREDGAGLAARSLSRPAQAGLGGRRRAARAAGRLPARLRRAAQADARWRVFPTATSATAACTCGSTSSSRTPRGRGRYREFVEERRRPGGVVRRLDVRRARRRPGAIRAAAADVLAAGDRPDAAGQADPRPRQPAQPWRAGRPGAVRRRPPSRRAPAPSAYDAAADPRRRVVRRTPSTAAPASASASPTTPARGGVMCPSYLATREEKDSTRGRARVLQDVVNGTLDLRRPGRRRRARPVPVLQGLRARLPDRHRHGDLQVGGAVAEVPPQGCAGRAPTTRSASCRAGPG